jgi:hypothetical protein
VVKGAHAIAYLRTSSAANVGSDKGSDKRQRNTISVFAKRPGYIVVDEFYDPAVSGADLLRRGRVLLLSWTGLRAVACRPLLWKTPAGSPAISSPKNSAFSFDRAERARPHGYRR